MDKYTKYNKNSPYWYGLRYGSNTPKASGYFGEIQIPGTDNVSTEYSMGVNLNGKDLQIPSITPNLDKDQLSNLVAAIRNKAEIPEDVFNTAVEHARQRIESGKSPFWSMPEKQYPIPTQNNYNQKNEMLLNKINGQPLGLLGFK